MQHAPMLARDQVGTGLVGWALAGIGILGSKPTPFFPRMEYSGVPSDGVFTRLGLFGAHLSWATVGSAAGCAVDSVAATAAVSAQSVDSMAAVGSMAAAFFAVAVGSAGSAEEAAFMEAAGSTAAEGGGNVDRVLPHHPEAC